MSAIKTPGVYIVEKNAFPDSVVEVSTAVPAFIGHTEKAADGNKSLLNKPWRITSMAEFQTYFGGAPNTAFSIVELKDDSNDTPSFESGGKKYELRQDGGKYLLYYSMLLFFANVRISSVVSPSVNITHEDQEELNVPLNGKAVNAIRTFIGEGTLVWGARTLDGNSLDWRYINVRRTMIMLEESIKMASKAYVFEPNVADTWAILKNVISSFLVGIWKRGGLVGASPEEAFSVNVGLGETMTSEDILEGIMRITVLVALTRPSEFQEITFQEQMRKS